MRRCETRPAARPKSPERAALALLLCVGAVACRRPEPPVDADGSSPGPLIAPAPAARPPDLTVGPAFTSATLRGFAGGPWLATALADGCVGQVAPSPVHIIELTEPAGLTITAHPIGTGFMDLGLAIRGPDGVVRCVDDSTTLDPVFSALLEAGRYEVFVAAVSVETPPCEVEVRAGLTPNPTIAVGSRFAAPVQDGPPPEALPDRGQFGGLRLQSGTGAAILEGTAGGTRRARDLGADCSGFVAQAPDHVLELLAPETLMLRVESSADTTLTVIGPGGQTWCRDDEDGLSPVLREPLGPGRYDVYVGVWEETSAPNYRLSVSR